MKKIFLLSLALMLCGGIAHAQVTVNGTVVDGNGNPIPGAKVTEKRSAQYAVTNMDGTFSLNLSRPNSSLVSEYVGWNPSTDRATDGMVIKMKKENWWTSKPLKMQWFVGVNVAIPSNHGNQFKNMSPGIMFGMVKNWGWYVKGQYNGDSEGDKYWGFKSIVKEYGKTEYWSASMGVIKRLGCPIHLYFGLGAVKYHMFAEGEDDEYYLYNNRYTDVGFLGDLGIIVRYNKFFLNMGAQIAVEATDESDGIFNVAPNIGFGYVF